MRRSYMLTRCGLMAALIAVCAQLAIPIQPVPLNLALLAVHLTAMLLPGRQALLSVGAYLLMGIVGLPVFAGFRGGAGALLEQTGGFILGYGVSTWITATILKGGRSSIRTGLALAAGTCGCYALGTVWFMALTGTPLGASLMLCILPFVPGDVAKAAAAMVLERRMRKAVRRSGL